MELCFFVIRRYQFSAVGTNTGAADKNLLLIEQLSVSDLTQIIESNMAANKKKRPS